MTIPIIGSHRLVVQLTLEVPPGIPDQAAVQTVVQSLSLGVHVAGWLREIGVQVVEPAVADGPRP